MNTHELLDQISRLKRRGKVHSNCCILFSKYPDTLWETQCSDRTLLIFQDDHGVCRLYFYTTDFDDMAELFRSVPMEREVVVELITRNPDEYKKELLSMEFQYFTSMRRWSNPDLPAHLNAHPELAEYDHPEIGRIAQMEDAPKIAKLLWDTFDTRTAHLLYAEEYIPAIQQGQFRIYERDGEIIALQQMVSEPKRMYGNQTINNAVTPAESRICRMLLIYYIKNYVNDGGKYYYGWIEIGNLMAEKTTRKMFGSKPDGLWTILYTKTN